MKKNNIDIKIKEGFGNIRFGMSPEDITQILGEPQEVENLEIDDENTTIILHYIENEMALFFANSRKPSLECMETSNRNTYIFGKQVFLMNECEIIDLFKKNGFENYDTETEIWGEKRITFEDAMIDFYFDDKHLSVISWGVLINENQL